MICGLSICLNLLSMLLQIDRKAGVAGSVADEIEVGGLGRVESSSQCRNSRIADWPWWKASTFISVVRTRRL